MCASTLDPQASLLTGLWIVTLYHLKVTARGSARSCGTYVERPPFWGVPISDGCHWSWTLEEDQYKIQIKISTKYKLQSETIGFSKTLLSSVPITSRVGKPRTHRQDIAQRAPRSVKSRVRICNLGWHFFPLKVGLSVSQLSDDQISRNLIHF